MDVRSACFVGVKQSHSEARRICVEQCGQATLEYALTLATLMAFIAALALLWYAGETGVLARLIEDASSHAFDADGILDIVLY